MAAQPPRWTRPWGSLGVGWLCALAALGIVGGSLIPLWALTDHLEAICLLLLALALLL